MAKKLPTVDKSSFFLAGGKNSILMLHGLTGTPYDLRQLGDILNKSGFTVSAPILKGHGDTPNTLLRAKKEDWLKEALAEYKKLSGEKFIVGLSMGALLAILLACKNLRSLKGVILLSPSLCLNLSGELLSIITKLGFSKSRYSIKKISGHSDILDPIARKKCPSLPEIPIASFNQFDELRSLALDNIEKINVPIFAAFGRLDSVLNIDVSSLLIKKANSRIIKIKYYNNSKHVITLDYDRDDLNKDIVKFITTMERG